MSRYSRSTKRRSGGSAKRRSSRRVKRRSGGSAKRRSGRSAKRRSSRSAKRRSGGSAKRRSVGGTDEEVSENKFVRSIQTKKNETINSKIEEFNDYITMIETCIRVLKEQNIGVEEIVNSINESLFNGDTDFTKEEIVTLFNTYKKPKKVMHDDLTIHDTTQTVERKKKKNGFTSKFKIDIERSKEIKPKNSSLQKTLEAAKKTDEIVGNELNKPKNNF